MVFDPIRSCYRYWWACLPAIPSSREAPDWWACGSDGRSSPYRRLKRVWNDATWFKRPKDDPFRPHEFSNPSSGTHMMVQLWENWTLFHPSEWVPAFLSELHMKAGEPPWDACWSYEFEDSSNSKLADITLHIRDGVGRETLFVIEAKWNKDRLKAHPKVGLPDANPDSYLGLTGYEVVSDRRIVYLVHERAAPHTTAQVQLHAGTSSCRWAVWTWEAMISLQCKLAMGLLPQPIGPLIRNSILGQAMPACIDWSAFQYYVGMRRDEMPDSRTLSSEFGFALEKTDCPERLRNYLLGTQCFWEFRANPDSMPYTLPFRFLYEEPSFRDLHELIHTRKAIKERCAYLAENTIPHWKLGISGPPQQGADAGVNCWHL